LSHGARSEPNRSSTTCLTRHAIPSVRCPSRRLRWTRSRHHASVAVAPARSACSAIVALLALGGAVGIGAYHALLHGGERRPASAGCVSGTRQARRHSGRVTSASVRASGSIPNFPRLANPTTRSFAATGPRFGGRAHDRALVVARPTRAKRLSRVRGFSSVCAWRAGAPARRRFVAAPKIRGIGSAPVASHQCGRLASRAGFDCTSGASPRARRPRVRRSLASCPTRAIFPEGADVWIPRELFDWRPRGNRADGAERPV
jgi:hypothetical protein